MPLEELQSSQTYIPPQLMTEEHRDLREMVEEGTLTPEGALAMIGIIPGNGVQSKVAPPKEEKIARATHDAIWGELARRQSTGRPRAYPIPASPKLQLVNSNDSEPDQQEGQKTAVQQIRSRASILATIQNLFGPEHDVAIIAKILIMTTQTKDSRLSINEIYEALVRESDNNIDIPTQRIAAVINILPGTLAAKGIIIHIKSEIKYRRNRSEMGYWLTIR